MSMIYELRYKGILKNGETFVEYDTHLLNNNIDIKDFIKEEKKRWTKRHEAIDKSVEINYKFIADNNINFYID